MTIRVARERALPSARRWLFALCLAATLAMACVLGSTSTGCGDPPPLPTMRESRPVVVMELAPRTPSATLNLMGSAVPWKAEQVSFEVSGRVVWSLLDGVEVEGPSFTDKGEELPDTGTVIARINNERYLIAEESARAELEQATQNVVAANAQHAALVARVEAARSKLAALDAGVDAAEANLTIIKTRVDSAIAAQAQAAAQVTSAQARARQAKAELDRELQLFETGGGTTEQAVEVRRTNYETAEAEVAQAVAGVASAEASVRASEAEVSGAEADVKAREADRDSQVAQVRAAEADELAQKANIAVVKAQTRQAEQKLAAASLDVKRCRLRAPFTGRVSRVYVERGAQVNAGTAVMTITVMDPIKVRLALSSASERQLNWSDAVMVVPSGETPDRAVKGHYYQDSTTADPATHTFHVDIIVRNRPIGVDDRVPDDMLKVPLAQAVWLVYESVPFAERYGQVFERSGNNPYRDEGEEDGVALEPKPPTPAPMVPIVFAGCIVDKPEDERHYAWRALNPPQRGRVDPVVYFERVELHLLRDPETGNLVKRVIAGEMMFLALDPTKPQKVRPGDCLLSYTPYVGVKNEQTGEWTPVVQSAAPDTGVAALVARNRWLFRPGDLVGVQLDRETPGEGLYVPLDAIVEQAGRPHVFIATREGDDVIAKRIAVDITGSIRDLRRIEGDGIKPGARVVVDGAQFLVADQLIRVVSERDPRSGVRLEAAR